ncbi:Plasmodium exported protein (PHIST), unknown function [Plasmodium malariae]|uniref:Plasmodium RESA N-terminal domain-containing protein n=1 Tax=Plasmodium malariae TaxID=5858 RepID=A0A1A8WIL6_PLAMA|nr:Plasmodium exported protein (PHIST), unknown function [Plasmodium malariae]
MSSYCSDRRTRTTGNIEKGKRIEHTYVAPQRCSRFDKDFKESTESFKAAFSNFIGSRKLSDRFFGKTVDNENGNLEEEEDIVLNNKLELKEHKNYYVPLNYINNNLSETFEDTPNYETVRKNEKQKKKIINNCDYEHYDVDNLEYLSELTEDDVNKRIISLGEYVDVKDMFVLWNYTNGFERIKYINMQKNIIQYCEDLATITNIPRKVKTEEWTKVYYFMKDELFYKEREFYKEFYDFLQNGPCQTKVFVQFINDMKLEWRNFRRGINSVCMEMINSEFNCY